MSKEPRKPKYAVNPHTGEIHKLKTATGACHVDESWPTFATLADVEKAGYGDRCGHCFPRKN